MIKMCSQSNAKGPSLCLYTGTGREQQQSNLPVTVAGGNKEQWTGAPSCLAAHHRNIHIFLALENSNKDDKAPTQLHAAFDFACGQPNRRTWRTLGDLFGGQSELPGTSSQQSACSCCGVAQSPIANRLVAYNAGHSINVDLL
jgi:hypothetical protein